MQSEVPKQKVRDVLLKYDTPFHFQDSWEFFFDKNFTKTDHTNASGLAPQQRLGNATSLPLKKFGQRSPTGYMYALCSSGYYKLLIRARMQPNRTETSIHQS